MLVQEHVNGVRRYSASPVIVTSNSCDLANFVEAHIGVEDVEESTPQRHGGEKAADDSPPVVVPAQQVNCMHCWPSNEGMLDQAEIASSPSPYPH